MREHFKKIYPECSPREELERRKSLEEKKMEIGRSLDLLKIDIDKTRDLKTLETEKEIESARSQLNVLKKESQR